MREIEFRGKCLKAGEWFYGYLHCVEDRAFLYTPEMIEVDPNTVGQFTGRTDKNGVEIYEGDIVKRHTYHGIENCSVVFSSGCFCWGEGSEVRLPCTPICYDKRIEVIGNIHDNPELLRQR